MAPVEIADSSMEVIKKFLTPSKYTRPQTKLEKVNKIVIHWVGNAKSTALGNWEYFESLKVGIKQIIKGKEVYKYASSHYIIGLKGEIIQNIPESEWAWCSNSANKESLSIECCHPDWTGKFTEATYNSLVDLCADICQRYNLDPLKDIVRHFDITRKICPKWFVDNPLEFEQFKIKVNEKLHKKSEIDIALDVLSNKKIPGINDTIINSPVKWKVDIENNTVNVEHLKLLLIKTAKYLSVV